MGSSSIGMLQYTTRWLFNKPRNTAAAHLEKQDILVCTSGKVVAVP